MDLQDAWWHLRPKEKVSIFTDASKQCHGRTGIGTTDMKRIRTSERLSDLFQVSSAELVVVKRKFYQE